MTNVALAGFPGQPFVIEPVKPEQVQFWASFAAQATARSAFSIVASVFHAFCMETSAYEGFQYVSAFRDTHLSRAVDWLDGVVFSLISAWESWQTVLLEFDRDRALQSSAVSWHLNATERAQALSLLLAQIVDGIVICCQQMQCALPGHTSQYLACRR